MCGLFGVIGSGVNQKDLQALNTLGTISMLRGRHGFGIAQGSIFGESVNIEVDKSNMDFTTHMDYNKEHNFKTQKGRIILGNISDNAFLGHVRHATFGSKSPENSHPFVFDNIVGMHNGSLSSYEFIPTGEGTDSYELFKAIDEEGAEDVLSRLSSWDAFALVWVDTKKATINFVRNKQRPLYWAVSKDRSTLWYASEELFLDFINLRHGLNLTNPQSFPLEVIHSIKPSQITKGETPEWSKTSVFIPAWQTQNRYEHTRTGTNVVALPQNSQRKKKGELQGRLEEILGVKNRDTMPWTDHEEANGFSFDEMFDTQSELTPEKLERAYKPVIRRIKGVDICTSVRHVPSLDCVVCRKEMSLFDLYKGSEISYAEGLHEECEEQFNALRDTQTA